jgi:hypothetical protein
MAHQLSSFVHIPWIQLGKFGALCRVFDSGTVSLLPLNSSVVFPSAHGRSLLSSEDSGPGMKAKGLSSFHCFT